MSNIWVAASDGDAERVQHLMATEALRPASPDPNGYTPVMAAASWGHVELLRDLLAKDPSSANVQDTDGDTPLHHVAFSELGQEVLQPVVEALMTYGANPKVQNSEGFTCLEVGGEDDEDDEEEIDMMDDAEPEEPKDEVAHSCKRACVRAHTHAH